jgi:hypothetical protein
MRLDTREGKLPRQILPKIFPFSLSPSPPYTPNRHQSTTQEKPQDPTDQCLLELNLSLSFGTRGHPSACPWRLKCRRQASHCYLANRALWPPSTMPNGWPPPTPSVGHSPAHALTAPVYALDAENGIGVLRRAHTFFLCTAPHPARHRSLDDTPPLPCTLRHPLVLAMSRNCCTSTEP